MEVLVETAVDLMAAERMAVEVDMAVHVVVERVAGRKVAY